MFLPFYNGFLTCQNLRSAYWVCYYTYNQYNSTRQIVHAKFKIITTPHIRKSSDIIRI